MTMRPAAGALPAAAQAGVIRYKKKRELKRQAGAVAAARQLGADMLTVLPEPVLWYPRALGDAAITERGPVRGAGARTARSAVAAPAAAAAAAPAAAAAVAAHRDHRGAATAATVLAQLTAAVEAAEQEVALAVADGADERWLRDAAAAARTAAPAGGAAAGAAEQALVRRSKAAAQQAEAVAAGAQKKAVRKAATEGWAQVGGGKRRTPDKNARMRNPKAAPARAEVALSRGDSLKKQPAPAACGDGWAVVVPSRHQHACRAASAETATGAEAALALKYFYLDLQNSVQGPFEPDDMRTWFEAGHLQPTLPIRYGESGTFVPLQVLFVDQEDPFAEPPLSCQLAQEQQLAQLGSPERPGAAAAAAAAAAATEHAGAPAPLPGKRVYVYSVSALLGVQHDFQAPPAGWTNVECVMESVASAKLSRERWLVRQGGCVIELLQAHRADPKLPYPIDAGQLAGCYKRFHGSKLDCLYGKTDTTLRLRDARNGLRLKDLLDSISGVRSTFTAKGNQELSLVELAAEDGGALVAELVGEAAEGGGTCTQPDL